MGQQKAVPKRLYALTDKGRERIAKAQRRRWRAFRKAKREAKKEQA